MLDKNYKSKSFPTHNDKYTHRDFKDVNVMVFDIDAINVGIINLISTHISSLPAKPEFGGELNYILFSQLDYVTINTLRMSITSTIKNWESRINVTEIQFKSSDEYNLVVANIFYTYNDTSITINGEVTVSIGEI